VYASNDLQTWSNEGFRASSRTRQRKLAEIVRSIRRQHHLFPKPLRSSLCRRRTRDCLGITDSPDCLTQCGRPHIIYNNQTSTYVLYVNAGSPGAAVLTSKSAASNYTYVGRSLIASQPPATQVGDFSIEVIDGTGYFVYSLIDFSTLGVRRCCWPSAKRLTNMPSPNRSTPRSASVSTSKSLPPTF
jgi:hypothetical protein